MTLTVAILSCQPNLIPEDSTEVHIFPKTLLVTLGTAANSEQWTTQTCKMNLSHWEVNINDSPTFHQRPRGQFDRSLPPTLLQKTLQQSQLPSKQMPGDYAEYEDPPENPNLNL